MIYLIAILIILDAVKDALYDNGKKFASGVIDIFYVSAIICGVVLFAGPWQWILVYFLLRYAVFDVIYNLIRRLPPLYIGTTKPYDKIIQKIGVNKVHFLFITKLMALFAGIALTL